jgi:hypothetical protein
MFWDRTSMEAKTDLDFINCGEQGVNLTAEVRAKSYSWVLGWLKVKVQISVVRAISMRLRASRKKMRVIECEDGARMVQLEN